MLQSSDNAHGVRSTSPASNPNSYNPVKTVSAPIEQATIGRSLVIKGEITGSEALYIDGRIEGKITLTDNRVTIGRNGTVQADITAREVVVMGKVTGNIECSDRVDIRSEGVVNGNVLDRADQRGRWRGTQGRNPGSEWTAKAAELGAAPGENRGSTEVIHRRALEGSGSNRRRIRIGRIMQA